MISPVALEHFGQIWTLFDRRMFEIGGSDYLVDPLRVFFPRNFAYELTQQSAHESLHNQLTKWGSIEQTVHEQEIEGRYNLGDGRQFIKARWKDPEVRWARNFILSSYYNVCCLGANKYTIEELIFRTVQFRDQRESDGSDKLAFYKMIGISNSFLLAEWAQDFIFKAVANSDEAFFVSLKDWLTKNTLRDNFDTSRQWVGTTLLWYLGGKDMPRRDFLFLLQSKKIIPKAREVSSFNGELSKLRLIR